MANPAKSRRAFPAGRRPRGYQFLEPGFAQKLFLDHYVTHARITPARALDHPAHRIIAERRKQGRCRRRRVAHLLSALLLVGFDAGHAMAAQDVTRICQKVD